MNWAHLLYIMQAVPLHLLSICMLLIYTPLIRVLPICTLTISTPSI
jgi:hypothetical protein